ncbi:glycosyltransferase 25 family member isoform X2 [Cherax quadricarinatus]|uniref:glycosyltransferase 25 family member isoform X2 n=1 Tax=Cherax quadricarinatus TaxID=27406 RepID=UPI002378C896|nr:glycosyltransferase 25 family member-like isoform X2 [Cherax quadricarinatus]
MSYFPPIPSAPRLFLLLGSALIILGAADQNQLKKPSVLVVLLARNKEHTLPYFLTLFERLEYPKKRLSLFIRSDHNSDKTITILDDWLRHNKHKYHSCDVKLDGLSTSYPGDTKGTEWGQERFNNLIKIKEEALALARHKWADYIWFLDMDVFLTRGDILETLIYEGKGIVAPMLNSLATYSNYWGDMTEDYWYTRSEDYIPILERRQKGCFALPMVHSCVFVDLRRVASDRLTFAPLNVSNYNGPNDDIITFAVSAKNAGIDMYVCNSEVYGFIPPPLDDDQHIDVDLKQLLSIKLEVLVEHPPLPVSKLLSKYLPPMPKKDKAGFDEIYLISLPRRPERRERMNLCFDELGLDVKLFDAVDGKKLNESYLRELGVKQMNVYKDPWSKRDMTFGEIGCFLSHYFIWEDIVNNGYKKVLLFEDDIRFEPYFREKVKHMIRQADRLLKWDLIYLGRKKLKNSDEPWVEDSDTLVHVDYSYWTLCYAITLEGAKKLLDGQPLGQLVPVDEYLPIMFNKHPETEWMEMFPVRNLNAFSVAPLYVYPTHYTGELGYISDTEESPIIQETDETAAAMESNLEGQF